MLSYLARRLMLAVFTIWAISVLAFVIIQLPPGDYVDAYIAQLAATGSVVSQQQAENLRAQYGLDQPMYVQYLHWFGGVLHWDFGISLRNSQPVSAAVLSHLSTGVFVPP